MLRSSVTSYLVSVNNLLIAYSESFENLQLHVINVEHPGTIEKSMQFNSSITALASYQEMVLIAFSNSSNTQPQYGVIALDPVTLKQTLLVDQANKQAKGYARALTIVGNKLYVGTDDSVQVFALNLDL